MGIIRKEQRERMKEYVVGLLEDARYPIISASQSEIVFGSRTPERKGERAHLYLHSLKRNFQEFKHDFDMALYNKEYVANIFYKDGENFHVRLAEEANAKQDKSLKLYSEQDLNMMLRLRELEKLVLDASRSRQSLTYYQPETARLQEGLREYGMDNVTLDYSHITADDKKYDFVATCISQEYRIAREFSRNAVHIQFAPVEKHRKVLAVIPPRS